MRYLILLILLTSGQCMAQSGNTPRHAELLQNSVNTATASVGVTGSQTLGWQNAVKSNPTNANNWLNYYLWTERDKTKTAGEKKEQLGTILSDSKAYIASSSQYQLMCYLLSAKKDTAAMNKALKMANKEEWILPFAIQYFIITNNQASLSEYCKKLNQSQPLVAALYQYYHDALMSADSNAVIYLKGINDMVPMAVLQQVYNIREDITLKYYSRKPSSNENTYLGLTIGREIIMQYPKASCTGLLVKISGKETFEELKRHVESDFNLNNLNAVIQESFDNPELYRNYLPAFNALYKYYTALKDERAEEYKLLINQIELLAERKVK